MKDLSRVSSLQQQRGFRMNVIDAIPHRLREKFLFAALAPIQALLPAAVIEGFCREAGYAWRERKWGPAVTVLACFWKQLVGTTSHKERGTAHPKRMKMGASSV
jgi:hypothetical protein